MSGDLNLRPYGNSWGPSASSAPAGTLEEQAHARARIKLEQLRSGHSSDVEAGPDYIGLIPAALLALILGLPFLLLAGALAGEKDAGAGVAIFGLFGLLFLSLPVWMFFRTRPQTSKGALLGFYRALGRGRYGRARRLTLRGDLDSFPRYQPNIQFLGRPGGYPRNFGDEQAFKDYWRELLRTQPLPYCIANLKNVRESNAAPDLLIVDFELKLMMNTSLWLFLLPLGWLIVLIVDLATRKTVTVQMRKLLVRVGTEWHIFSAEWQGYEEYNLNWLHAPQQAYQPEVAAPVNTTPRQIPLSGRAPTRPQINAPKPQPGPVTPPPPPRNEAPWERPKSDRPSSPKPKAPWE